MDQPSTAPAATGHKTYVFVDEYNRHKRLKVMRACDGCRKRKIRCDGALQNGPWPCGACTRLKLKCVPPTLDADDDWQSTDGAAGQSQFSFQNHTPSSIRQIDSTASNHGTAYDWSPHAVQAPSNRAAPTSAPASHDIDTSVYSSHFLSQQSGPRSDPVFSDDEYFASTEAQAQFQSNVSGAPSFIRSQTEASTGSGGDPQEVDATVRELSEQMGDLAIDLSSAAPYIANEKKNLAETPAVEEVDIVLPPSVSTDTTVRIPPEMMPSEERALDYFRYYFDYIHPYVPVLNRQQFYDQWHSARHSLSPLILEGIFACVSRYLEDTTTVRKWLALASRHEESFKDVPRLSTIQALMILTKAREAVPKRGYYYRSWMAVKYMTTMAHDLGLDEHCQQHRGTVTCTLSKVDCMVRTRMWQILFGLEIWVGAPQGRTDFAIDLDTVDFSLPVSSPEVHMFEYQTSRKLTFLAQALRNIKQTNDLWRATRNLKKDWALDPSFVRQNEATSEWLRDLPTDMQIHYSDDDDPPWINNDHFVAYIHIYHHLIVLMQHRPQLQILLEQRDHNFQTALDVCNESAMSMCRLQEALFRDFGLHGLQFMQRGVGFTIYCILTCTMLHLATITSPDPDANTRARNFFTRHMRILEHCISSATPEVQVQINALREAFSQDIHQPFELKQGLGLRSPSLSEQSPLLEGTSGQTSAAVPRATTWSHLQDSSPSSSMTPSSEYGPSFEHMVTQHPMVSDIPTYNVPDQGVYIPGMQHSVSAPQQGYALEPVISNEHPIWDPSGIFQQWNTAFGAQAQAPPPPPPPAVTNPYITSTSAPMMPQHQYSSGSQQAIYTSHYLPTSAAPVMPAPMSAMPAVTPVMWQDAFTNAYVSGHGHKRYREEGFAHGHYNEYTKRRG